MKYRTLNPVRSSTLYRFGFSLLDMAEDLPSRVDKLMKYLKVDQVQLGVLAGASKSVVNQWRGGGIKSMNA